MDAQIEHTSSLEQHVLELWPNFWHLKHLLGFGTYLSTGKRSNPKNRCVGKYSDLKVRKKVPVKILEPFFWMDTVCWLYLWELFIPWASIDFLDDVLGGESVGWSAKLYQQLRNVDKLLVPHLWHLPFPDQHRLVLGLGYWRSMGVTC